MNKFVSIQEILKELQKYTDFHSSDNDAFLLSYYGFDSLVKDYRSYLGIEENEDMYDLKSLSLHNFLSIFKFNDEIIGSLSMACSLAFKRLKTVLYQENTARIPNYNVFNHESFIECVSPSKICNIIDEIKDMQKEIPAFKWRIETYFKEHNISNIELVDSEIIYSFATPKITVGLFTLSKDIVQDAVGNRFNLKKTKNERFDQIAALRDLRKNIYHQKIILDYEYKGLTLVNLIQIIRGFLTKEEYMSIIDPILDRFEAIKQSIILLPNGLRIISLLNKSLGLSSEENLSILLKN